MSDIVDPFTQVVPIAYWDSLLIPVLWVTTTWSHTVTFWLRMWCEFSPSSQQWFISAQITFTLLVLFNYIKSVFEPTDMVFDCAIEQSC